MDHNIRGERHIIFTDNDVWTGDAAIILFFSLESNKKT